MGGGAFLVPAYRLDHEPGWGGIIEVEQGFRLETARKVPVMDKVVHGPKAASCGRSAPSVSGADPWPREPLMLTQPVPLPPSGSTLAAEDLIAGGNGKGLRNPRHGRPWIAPTLPGRVPPASHRKAHRLGRRTAALRQIRTRGISSSQFRVQTRVPFSCTAISPPILNVSALEIIRVVVSIRMRQPSRPMS